MPEVTFSLNEGIKESPNKPEIYRLFLVTSGDLQGYIGFIIGDDIIVRLLQKR